MRRFPELSKEERDEEELKLKAQDAKAEKSRKAWAVHDLIESSGVLKRHYEMIPQVSKTGQWYEELKKLGGKLGTGFLYGLIGPRGTGKSQIATNLIIHACYQEQSARYARAMDIFLDIRSSYQPNSRREDEIIREYTRPSLLVIDELQERTESAFESRSLTYIIDQRYANNLDTLLISNLTEAEFTKSVGSSIASRMTECGGLIVCDWPSFRIKGPVAT